MPDIAYAAPFRMEDATLSLGANQYEATVSSAALTPAPSTGEFRAINGDVNKRVGKSAFTLDITFGQDTITANSLALYLYQNAGTKVAFELVAQEDGATWAGEVWLTEGAIGGATNTDAVATVSLQCEGKPVLTPAA